MGLTYDALTAVVTLLAVLLGGWLSVHGQERLWRRDHARQWRDIRLNAYKEFLAAFRHYIAFVLSPSAQVSAVPHPRKAGDLMPFFDQSGMPYKERLEATKTAVRLISAEEATIQACNQLVRHARLVAADRATLAAHDSRGAQTIMPYSGLPGFSYPIVLGIAAILFSFGRGLLYFFPGLVLLEGKRIRVVAGAQIAQVYYLWLLFLGGLIVVYAGWWAWHGGWSWGPRFFVFAILPASLALAVRLDDTSGGLAADLVTLGALLLSVWGAAASTVYFGHWPPQCLGPGGIEELCHFAPEFSQLWYPVLAKPQLSGTQIAVLGYYVTVALWLGSPVAQRISLSIRKAVAGLPRTGWQL